jgi:hypothetical protein
MSRLKVACRSIATKNVSLPEEADVHKVERSMSKSIETLRAIYQLLRKLAAALAEACSDLGDVSAITQRWGNAGGRHTWSSLATMPSSFTLITIESSAVLTRPLDRHDRHDVGCSTAALAMRLLI